MRIIRYFRSGYADSIINEPLLLTICYQDDYECTTRLIVASEWPHFCETLNSTFDLVKVVKVWHGENQAEDGPIIVIDKYGNS